MSTPAVPELHAPTEPVRGRFNRVVNYNRRHAWISGLALWAAAAAVLAAHSTGTAFPDPMRFAMTDAWLIGLGCIGCPILPLRALARRFQPEAFRSVALVSFALAMLLTVLILGGAMHPNALNGTFEMILPLAAGIHGFNAADAEVHARKREGVAHQSGREEAVAGLIDQGRAALAGLDRLEAMSIGELDALIETAYGIREAKRADHPLLRLVAGDLSLQIDSASRIAQQ